MLASLINAMSERMPGSWQPISWEPETFTTPLLNVAIAFGGSLILTVFVGKYLPKTRAFSSLTLHETIKKVPIIAKIYSVSKERRSANCGPVEVPCLTTKKEMSLPKANSFPKAQRFASFL